MQTKSSVPENLVQERKGGVFNIRGISFQVNYTIWRLLIEFQEDGGNTKKFQLEGVEDLDFYELRSEHIQIKCLNKSLGANDFSKKILPNLVEVFEQAPESRFTIVSNQHISRALLHE